MERLLTDLKWIVFQVQYCLGGANLFDSRLCQDFRPWAIGATALLAAFVFVMLWHWLARQLRAWSWRRLQARVANKETMDRYRWTGDSPKQ
jgi:hypothetical protein